MSSPKLHTHILVILVTIFVSLCINLSHSQRIPNVCHPHDKKVLLRIKSKLGNPNSLRSWDSRTDCCIQWNDIWCNQQGHVVTLRIAEANDIHGPIPPFLDQLPWLTRVFFQNIPNLSGPIPSYIGKLTNLTILIITGTRVTGPIPYSFGRFTKMLQLDLSSNKLTGPIPDQLGRLKNLQYLELSFNRLTGPIPMVLAKLTNLNFLRISFNKLTGPIPSFLANLKNLDTIEFESNSLSGPIPTNLGQQSKLTRLSFTDNKLSGSISKSLGKGNLVFIRLGKNKFTGDASFLFEKANSAVIDIRINNNLLKFDFTNVNLARSIMGFNISHNKIFGSLPKRFGQVNVDLVDVSYNQLCGPITNSPRFKQADPIIFAHNKCLCGGPLPPCK